MVWIINDVPKVVEVRLGSQEMMSANNLYRTRDEAMTALQGICKHPTLIGNSATGHICCADCLKPHN